MRFLSLALTLLFVQDSRRPDWSRVNDFVYQLQNADLDALGKTKFDLVIIDYSRDGSDAARFTPQQIAALRKSSGGAKLVLAYLSIGEAENYRGYWRKEWDADGDGKPDNKAPGWLGPSNPDWPGNYKVRYWDAKWQAVVFATLDKIIDAGFDGVYLDIIDAYEFWGPKRKTAEREMVEFVKRIAARARRKRKHFGVFPQNGEGLGRHKDYLRVVTGIGKEDLWFDGNDPQSKSYRREALAALNRFKRAGKLVLVTDYVTRKSRIKAFYGKARTKGSSPTPPCATLTSSPCTRNSRRIRRLGGGTDTALTANGANSGYLS